MRTFDERRLQQGWEVARTIMQGFLASDIFPVIYPALFTGGVLEGSFHSYMLSALLLLGERLGYSPVCDSPIFDKLDNLLLGEGNKRPDSVWFDRGTEIVRVLIEFERYKTSSLEPKTRNLLIMANACTGDLDLLVLMYWTLKVIALSDLQDAYGLAKRGFSSKGVRFGTTPCPILLLETIAKKQGERLLIDGFVAKQFVFGGENKDYVVENLNLSNS